MESGLEVDSRVDACTRSTREDMDVNYLHQLREDENMSGHYRSDTEKQAVPSNLVKEAENIYVDFELDDPRNPFNFTRKSLQHMMRYVTVQLTANIYAVGTCV
jgi:hypothetical protein